VIFARPYSHLPTVHLLVFFFVFVFVAVLSDVCMVSEVSAGEAANHPVIQGFDRFDFVAKNQTADSGRLLLGELGCRACHTDKTTLPENLARREAPILDAVGSRVRRTFLRAFIADPQRVKPGTTMPNLFCELSPADRTSRVEALVQFLASTGTVKDVRIDQGAASRGQKVYRSVGCLACHAPQSGHVKPPAHSIPFGDLAEKYTVRSLSVFLRNPQHVRPSGRMPSLNLSEKQAVDVANYLLRHLKYSPGPPNWRYQVFRGHWPTLPDYGKLKPIATGVCFGPDLTVAHRTTDFGVQFEGTLRIDQAGDYTFHLGSDDGSRLTVDGKKVVDNDGEHPHTIHSGKVHLTAGRHPLRVDYAQVGGDWTLTLEYEGPGTTRQPVTPSTLPGYQPVRGKTDRPRFVLKPSLVERGRHLFASMGCAACHQMKVGGKRLASKLAAQPLRRLRAGRGCLASQPSKGIPDFSLSRSQKAALQSALNSPPEKPLSPQMVIDRTMLAYNCYGCHRRSKKGGPPRDREARFVTTIREMGDEGRIPPPLDGVGDKLNSNWLATVLDNGAKDRPYMLTRMPRFGKANVGHLLAAFVAADRKTDRRDQSGGSQNPRIDLPDYRIKAIGRFMVGAKALSCVKCHYFGPYKATGIQSLDLQKMTRRLRKDWFLRYMVNPQVYRPGTRMPAGYVQGRAVISDVLDGNPGQQLSAIWLYLQDGNKAAPPFGLVHQGIELVPRSEPIIYRNFIEGVSPRGIAVGYPEKVNLAFDADELCLKLIWHGAFIDAGRHWNGRGQGFEPPLGDHVIHLVGGVPFAVLSATDTPWPKQSARQRGFRFRGYRLDSKRRPTFLYGTPSLTVEDRFEPVTGKSDSSFRRTLRLRGTKKSATGLWFRAASANRIDALGNRWYRVNGGLKIRIETNTGRPVVRTAGQRKELLVPIQFHNGRAFVQERFVW